MCAGHARRLCAQWDSREGLSWRGAPALGHLVLVRRLQRHLVLLNALSPALALAGPWSTLVAVSWPRLAGLKQSPVAHFQPGTPGSLACSLAQGRGKQAVGVALHL